MKKYFLILMGLFLLFIISSCGPAVPTKELEDAKTSLERAKSVDAPVYASDDYMAAESDFVLANQYVTDKKNKEAKDSADASKIKSEKAYAAAREKRSDDIYQQCAALLDTSEKNFAPKLFPDRYQESKNEFNSVKSFYDKKDIDNTYSNGIALKPKLENLANGSSAEVEKTRSALAEAQDKYDSAENKDIVRAYALDDLRKAVPLLEGSRNDYNKGELEGAKSKAKDAIGVIDSAVAKAENAYQKTLGQKKSSQETIDLEKQKELEVQKQKASDYIEQAKLRLEKLKIKNKTGFIPDIKYYSYSITHFIYFGQTADTNGLSAPSLQSINVVSNTNEEPAPVEEPTDTNVTTTSPGTVSGEVSNSPAVPATQPETVSGDKTNSNTVTAPQPVNEEKTATNTIENVSESMAEKYLKMAEESFSKEEYLDSMDYARESIRISDILLAEEVTSTYLVKLNPQNRDCLWKISGYMYKNKTWLWPTIWRANKYQIQDPDLIYPGQKLKIPPDLLE